MNATDMIIDLKNNSSLINDSKFIDDFTNAIIEYSDKWKLAENFVYYFNIQQIFDMFPPENLSKIFRSQKGYALLVTFIRKDMDVAFDNILSDDNLAVSFYNEWLNFYSESSTFSYDISYKLIKYANDHNLDEFVQPFFNSEVFDELMESDLSDKIKLKIIRECYHESSIQKFLNSDLALRNINSIDNKFLFDEKRKIPVQILNSSDFFNKIKNSDIIDFRSKVNKLITKNPSYQFYTNVKKYEEEIINSVEDGIFSDLENLLVGESLYNNYSSIKTAIHMNPELLWSTYYETRHKTENPTIEDYKHELRKYTNVKLSEIIVDYLFEDNFYNVRINLEEILRYNTKRPILDDEKIRFYETIYNIDSMSTEDKIAVFNTFKDRSINTIFYEDLKALKLNSYQHINEDIINVDTLDNKVNDELSDIYGTKIIDLRDSEFKMIVRTISYYNYNTTNSNQRDCYSLIGDKNTSTFHGSIIYGYQNIDTSKFISVYEADSYSSNTSSHIDNGTPYINRIMTSDEIIEGNYYYSEIDIQNNKIENQSAYETLKPSYIVCKDIISSNDIDEANRLGIPIVLIKEHKLEYDKAEREKNIFEKDKYKYVFDRVNSEIERARFR